MQEHVHWTAADRNTAGMGTEEEPMHVFYEGGRKTRLDDPGIFTHSVFTEYLYISDTTRTM